MSYARYKGKLLSPVNQRELLSYDAESDVLWLVNGGPVAKSKMLFPGCDVYFDDEKKSVTGISISHAKKQLWPILSAEDGSENIYVEKSLLPTGIEMEIIYVRETDTLSLSNGAKGAAGVDLFMGCIVFTDKTNEVASIMLDDAGYLILPLFDGSLGGN